MTVPVGWLADQAGLGLTVRAGAVGLSRRIEWAHSSELLDPTPWLDGREFLLTTGIRLLNEPHERRVYVERLAASGIAGLGFGVGMSFEEVPTELVDAAEAAGLPLLEIPLATPFIAVTKSVVNRLVEQQYEGVVRASEAQPAMTRAALRGGSAAVVRELALATGSEVVLFSAGGECIAAHPPDAAARVGEWRTQVPQSRHQAASAVSIDASGIITWQPVRVGRHVRGRLVLHSRRELTHVDRLLLGHGISLMALEPEKPWRLRSAERRVNSMVLGLILDRTLAPEDAKRYFADAGFVANGICALAVDGVSPHVALGGLDAVLAEDGVPMFGIETEGAAVVVLPYGDPKPAVELISRTTGGLSSRSRCGYADVQDLDQVPEAVRRALIAARVARSRDVGLVDFGSMAGQVLLSVPETRNVLSVLAETRLSPLADHDARHGTSLLPTLRAFLEHNGQGETAAAVLGIHRHTLRARIGRITDLLGVDLDSAQVRAELLLAAVAWQPSR